MDLAIKFNNEGVIFLQNDNRKDAITMFRGAIKLVQVACKVTKPHSIDYLNDAIEINQAYLILQEDRNQCGLAMAKTRRERNMYKESISSFMYGKPIELPYLSSLGHQIGNTDVKTLISAVILYNTGLSHHTRPYESAPLRTTLTLYRMAYELCSELDDDDFVQSELSCRLVLAVLNNMAHICHEGYCDYDQARFYLEQMHNFLQNIDINISTENEWFYANAIIYGRDNGAGAA